MFVLDRLWRGEISPCEKAFRRGGTYHRLMEDLCKTENRLLDQLSPDGKELLTAYINRHSEIQAIENRESFIEGFRLGAGLLLDVVNDYSGEFQNPADE